MSRIGRRRLMARWRVSRPLDTVRRRLGRLRTAQQLALVAVGVVGVLSVVIATRQIGTFAKGYGPASDGNAAAMQNMLQSQAAVGGYVFTRDPIYVTRYRQASAAVDTSLTDTLHALARVGDHSLDAEIASERTLAHGWLSQAAAPILAAPDPIMNVVTAKAGRTLFDQFSQANEVVGKRLTTVRDNLRAQASNLRMVTIPAIVVATVLALLGAVLIGARAARGLADPLLALWSTVRRIDAGELSARADARVGPVEVRAVAEAVNVLGAGAEHAAAAEAKANEQRDRLRATSAAIRSATNPREMAEHALTDVGPLLELDRALLLTFTGASIPGLVLDWPHRLLDRPPAVTTADLDRLRPVIEGLWERAALRSVNDRGGATADMMGELASRLGATAWVAAPVGDSSGAVGILLLMVSHGPREWTATELSLVQRLAAELGHAMAQGHLIAGQRETVDRLEALEEAKSAFIASVSHELRTPLTSISGYLEMVLDGDAGELPDAALDMLQIVDRNAVRLRNLIEDLLTQSRIDAGRLQVNPKRCDLGALVLSVRATMAPLANSASVGLSVEPGAPGEAVVIGDAAQLEQALTNLVANAIKFTRPGGQVAVVARREVDASGPLVAIVVTDTGIGIPADDLPHLFDRFFRAGNAVSGAIAGTGLGLPIVREIVVLHGGTLDVQSVVDKGTTVTLRLRTAPADRTANGPDG